MIFKFNDIENSIIRSELVDHAWVVDKQIFMTVRGITYSVRYATLELHKLDYDRFCKMLESEYE